MEIVIVCLVACVICVAAVLVTNHTATQRLHQRCTGRDSATKATGRSGNWLCRKRSGSCHSRCQERSRTAKEKRITGSQR